MNITERISTQIGSKIGKFIQDTPEIQVYWNWTVDKYQWRDSRFPEYSDQWQNVDFSDDKELIEFLINYIGDW